LFLSMLFTRPYINVYGPLSDENMAKFADIKDACKKAGVGVIGYLGTFEQ
jgi:hypothetical protein